MLITTHNRRMGCQNKYIKIILVYAIGLSVFMTVHSTLSKTKSQKVSKKNGAKVSVDKNGALSITQSVADRGLVTPTPTLLSIINNHALYCHSCRREKKTHADVLGYVTPWNNHGYDVAKIFGSKMSMISPVWLQLLVKDKQYDIGGKHDVDKGWIRDVRRENADIKILPRLLFDRWSAQDFQHLFSSEDEMDEVSQIILGTVQEYKFSGIVLELWSQLGLYFRSELIHFVNHLARTLHSESRQLILVVPPPIDKQRSNNPSSGGGGGGSIFDKSDFDRLKTVVDAFSLMTYDYSSLQSPGYNAPLAWMRQCVEHLVPESGDPDRLKLLLGLNFYGYQYNSFSGPASVMEAVVGSKFVDTLKSHKPKVTWHEEPHEATFTYKVQGVEQTVVYPTLQSIADRIELASQLNTAISIWELGQGLDYFYDLL